MKQNHDEDVAGICGLFGRGHYHLVLQPEPGLAGKGSMRNQVNQLVIRNLRSSKISKNSIRRFGKELLFVCIVVLLIGFIAGCSCLRNCTNCTDEWGNGSLAALETQAVEVVKDWYRRNGYNPPQRIIVHETNGDRCTLSAGQEDIESGFEVDLKRMKVVKFTPGD